LDVYSVLLLIAMIAAGAALVGAVAARLRGQRFRPTEWADTTGRLGALAALVSLGIHFGAGHRPGTLEALGLGGFLAAHPAPLVTMAVAILAVWLSRPRHFGPDKKARS
jgi:hypothetical protein